MNWAWDTLLPPTPKLVLMKLADAADDDDFCFPSIPLVAAKSSVSERTVQRILHDLTRDGYIVVEQRFRENGARTSNGYRLQVGWYLPVKLAPAPVTHDTPPVTPVSGGRCHPCHHPGDTGDGVTTTEPVIYPTLQPPPAGREVNADPASGVGEGRRDLCFPGSVSQAQQRALARQFDGLSRETAQEVLDELAGRMNATQIRDPVGYGARLVERARRGEFRPGIGRAVAKRRHVDEHGDRARFESRTSIDPQAGATVQRLPECFRNAAELVRQGARAEPNRSDAIAQSPCDRRPSHDAN
jgi:hypothetical protein